MPFLASVRSRFSSLFSKASEPEEAKLPEWAYQTPRAGFSPYDQVSANNQRLSLNIAYRLEQEVSIFSDIALTLRQELFRNGVEWEQKFACKCALCGAEHEEFVEVCETCGSPNVYKPNPAQKLKWGHADKTDFFLVANKTGQSFKDVLEDMEFNLDVADRCIALVLKYYGLDDEGNITTSIPLEILSLDPRFTRLIYDVKTGLPGGEGKICLVHRDDLQGEDKTTCKHCGKKLYEAIAKTEYPGHNEYYVEGEIFWTSKYFPKFGRPPVFAIIDDAWAYHYLEKRIRNYFEKGRPPSILEVPSANGASVSTQMANMVTQLNQNSDYFPWIATDPASHKGLSVVNLMNDPSPEMLEVKADIRLRFGSYFGVMPLFQGDVGSAGGLNNESRQLEVSNRAFTRGQAIFNDKFFPWLMQQFGITDWKLVLAPAEDADELAEEQIISAQFDNMKKALDMGMVVEYKSGKVTYSGSPQKVQQLMPPLALDGSIPGQESGNPVPGENNAAEGPEPMNEGLSFEEVSKQNPELTPDEKGGIDFGSDDLKEKSDCPDCFIKAHTCPPGQHSHDDYEGGRCHDANQVHRGGRTDSVGPETSDSGKGEAPLQSSAASSDPNAKRISELVSKHRGGDGYVSGYMADKDDFMLLYRRGLIKKDTARNRWYFTSDADKYAQKEAPKETPTPEPKKEEKKPETKSERSEVEIAGKSYKVGNMYAIRGKPFDMETFATLKSIGALEYLDAAQIDAMDLDEWERNRPGWYLTISPYNVDKIASSLSKSRAPAAKPTESQAKSEKKSVKDILGSAKYVSDPEKAERLKALDGAMVLDDVRSVKTYYVEDEGKAYLVKAGFDWGKNVKYADIAEVEPAKSIAETLKQKSDPDLSSLSHEEYVDYISPKPFMKSSADYLIQALLKLQKWTEFEKLAPQEAEEVYRSIIGIMTREGGWSLDMVQRDLKKRFPQLTDYDAERIARTETSAIANKARELDFKDSQPEDTLYYWGGPDDDRTSGICREIKKILDGKGLPLEQLRTLCNEVAIKYGLKPRDWVLHPNERHTIRIWYGDL